MENIKTYEEAIEYLKSKNLFAGAIEKYPDGSDIKLVFMKNMDFDSEELQVQFANVFFDLDSVVGF